MRFLKVLGWLVLGLIGLAVLAMSFDEKSSDQLEVRTKLDPILGVAPTLVVKNVGREPITIIDVTVNDRPECKPEFIKESTGPLILKVGDSDFAITKCEVVRTKIKTNKGAFEYSFSARR